MEKFITAKHFSLVSKDRWRWKYFTPMEMADKRDGSLLISESFLDTLELLRIKCGFPLIVTSGYRTPEHNMLVSNTGPKGPHTRGKAVDISVSYEKAFILLKYAINLGFTGIGINQKGKNRFIHLDTLTKSEGFPRPTIWSY